MIRDGSFIEVSEARERLELFLGKFRTTVPRIKESWKLLYEYASDIAYLYVLASGQKKLPVRLNSILKYAQINLTYSTEKRMISDGMLRAEQDGFQIIVNSDIEYTRERTTIAHEIGHTLFYDPSYAPPRRVYAADFPQRKREEWVCFAFARSLLLPKEFVTEQFRGALTGSAYRETTLLSNEISKLWKQSEVSFEILGLRLLSDLKLFPSAALIRGNIRSPGDRDINWSVSGSIIKKKSLPILGNNGILAKIIIPEVQASANFESHAQFGFDFSRGEQNYHFEMVTPPKESKYIVYGLIASSGKVDDAISTSI